MFQSLFVVVFVVVVVSDTPESEFVCWGDVALENLLVSNLTTVDTYVAMWLSWRFCLLLTPTPLTPSPNQLKFSKSHWPWYY